MAIPASRLDVSGSGRRSIPDLLDAAHPAISFEFFPPKDESGEAILWDAVRRLERVRPAFVSVTYGAGGSTQDRTVRATARIAAHTDFLPMAHLTCVGASVTELRRVVGRYAEAGVRNVLALRGDPPGGLGTPWTRHDDGLDHAEELVALVRSLGDFTVGVAAFPDKHPESASLDADVDVLLRKQEAGAAFAITQFVFDVDAYLRLRDRVAERGSNLPIVPSIMPVTSYPQLRRMAELSGQPLPEQVTARLSAVSDDVAAVRSVGVEIACQATSRLLAEGAPGVHFITMNRSTATLEVVELLGLTG